MGTVQRTAIASYTSVIPLFAVLFCFSVLAQGEDTNGSLRRWVIYDAQERQFYLCKDKIEQSATSSLLSPKKCVAWKDDSNSYFVTQSVINFEVVNGKFLTSYQLINQNVQTIAPFAPQVYTGAPLVATPPAAAREGTLPIKLTLDPIHSCDSPPHLSVKTDGKNVDIASATKASLSLCMGAWACSGNNAKVSNNTFAYLYAWAQTLAKISSSDFTVAVSFDSSKLDTPSIKALNACGVDAKQTVSANSLFQTANGDSQATLDQIYINNSPDPAPTQMWQQPKTAETGRLVLCRRTTYKAFKTAVQDSPDTPSDECTPPAPPTNGGGSDSVKPKKATNNPSATAYPRHSRVLEVSSDAKRAIAIYEPATYVPLSRQFRDAGWRVIQQNQSQAPSVPAAPSNSAVDPDGARPAAVAAGVGSVAPSVPTAAPASAAPGPGQVAPPPAALPAAAVPPAPGPTSTAPPPQYVDSRNFEVRLKYHASILAGFFVSSLGTNQYGFTNSGQAGTTFVNVVVAQNYSRPQMHAFTGVNLYFKPHDSNPGPHTGLFEAQQFGVLIGYGIDGGSNYLAGLNWQVKNSGLNISGGAHIGQVAQLAPGTYAGVTEFPSSLTTVPTVNRTKLGGFVGVSLDSNTMKTAIASLFGK